ncbi:HNH endonuclease [Promicromonospora panici]|uniref:HNH endonuclease n=1 Tax=Promicromonospora panici TaxID=2219658 RepID=UPI0013EA9FFE|nr:HNH endonuclease signature motif containing protein [Promicromonospora panici]
MLEPTVGRLSQTAQLAVDELYTSGLAQFARQHKRQKADDQLIRFGQMAVPLTSMAAAIIRLNTDITANARTDLTAPINAERLLGEHGLDAHTAGGFQSPEVGDQFLSRTDVWRAYGGDRNAGIIRFPGDDVVNCFSDDDSGSYADDEPSVFEPFGYRGEGLHGDQKFIRGNRRLEEALQGGSVIRFWHRPLGGAFTFLYWCAVVGRRWDRGIDADGRSRKEIVWILHKVSDPLNVEVPEHVMEVGRAEIANMNAGPGPEVKDSPSYLELRHRAIDRDPNQSRHDYLVRRPIRSRAARRAVLLRAQNKCEAPWCEGMPVDRLESGEAILEVDHVDGLAGGGDDSPSNMVALCPNCHASKTRGKYAKSWQRKLVEIARRNDSAMMQSGK